MANSKPEILHQLAEELLKDSPDEKAVEHLMNQVQLPYSKDPIARLECVLRALGRRGRGRSGEASPD